MQTITFCLKCFVSARCLSVFQFYCYCTFSIKWMCHYVLHIEHVYNVFHPRNPHAILWYDFFYVYVNGFAIAWLFLCTIHISNGFYLLNLIIPRNFTVVLILQSDTKLSHKRWKWENRLGNATPKCGQRTSKLVLNVYNWKMKRKKSN